MREISVARIGNAETVLFACEELKKYLLAINKTAVVDILEYDSFEPDRKNVLWVGIDETFGKKMPEVKDKNLDDAILIDVTDFCGIISGDNDRSVLIAAYRFLRELGVQFVRPGPDGEIVPELELSICRVAVCEAPSYRHRCVCIEGAVSEYHAANMIDWIPKVGLNGYFIQFFSSHIFYNRWYNHLLNPGLQTDTYSKADSDRIEKAICYEIAKRSLVHMAVGHGWTCIPFGMLDFGQGMEDSELSDEYRSLLAEHDGKRELRGKRPQWTQLCYSNPKVRHTIADAIVKYSFENPSVDYVDFALADGTNNHCECAECRKKTPSDWYVDILNEADEKLTAAGLDTKIMFAVYVDTLWAPKASKLKHTERFAIEYAPITRTFYNSYKELDAENYGEIPPFSLNKNKFPSNVGTNVKMLENWQKGFMGDTLDFDYHLWAAHVRDLGYAGISKVFFDDCQSLDKIKCDGYISCQPQRVSCPTNLPMTAMAAALWDKTANYKTVCESYYKTAFGDGWKEAKKYLEKLSALSRPGYSMGSKKLRGVSEKKLAAMQHEAYSLADGILPTIEKYMSANTNPTQKRSWEILLYHREIAKRFILVFIADHEGLGKEEIRARYGELINCVFSVEPELHTVFDSWRIAQGLNEWYK